MEERILDDDESRGIKIRRTPNGGTDAVDGLTEGDEDDLTEEEIYVDLPEEEYDEDLVGLTPTQLKEELERREKLKRDAQEESERLKTSADEKLAEGKFADAELLYAQALVCDGENGAAVEGLWTARTENFTDAEAVFQKNAAEEIADNETARAIVVEKLGGTLQAMRASYAEEEAKIAPDFEKKQGERREAFAANRRYYFVRFTVFLFIAVLFCIGIGVSAYFIPRTRGDVPVIFVGVFAGLNLVALAVAVVYARKLFVASRLYAENEKFSSTETGTRVAFLRERLHAIDLILDEADVADEDEFADEETAEGEAWTETDETIGAEQNAAGERVVYGQENIGGEEFPDEEENAEGGEENAEGGADDEI